VLQEVRAGRIDKWAFNEKLIEDIKNEISRWKALNEIGKKQTILFANFYKNNYFVV